MQNTLLDSVHLNERHLEHALNQVMTSTVDFADIFLQSTTEESWTLEDGVVKDTHFSIDQGFGLRVISGERVGFAYADDIDQKTLSEAAKSAKSIAHQGGTLAIPTTTPLVARSLYSSVNPLHSFLDQQKIDLLQHIDQYARRLDSRVKQVIVNLSGSYEVMLVMNSQGVLVNDIRPLVNLWVQVLIEEDHRREMGSFGGGGRGGYQDFFSLSMVEEYARAAVRHALIQLEAKPAPAGTFPVVLGPGWPAILLHEAIGHGLEADFNRKGSSAFSHRLGERVATSLCTIVDDGTLPNRRGSLSVDDEGTPTECTVLIEKGILKNYMQDKHNARLMKMQPTGNGRRESYADLPMPRMTNTYMLPGEHDPEEIIASIDRGLYAVNFSDGEVDITSGKFVFNASEAYWVENGKIQYPVKGASLIGNGPDVLTKVSMVGNDLKLDNGIGTCGKSGQSVPVGVGQPTLRVDALTVGGTQG